MQSTRSAGLPGMGRPPNGLAPLPGNRDEWSKTGLRNEHFMEEKYFVDVSMTKRK